MQDRAGFALNCTANDVSVAGVARTADNKYDISITDPCSKVGDDVTFTARFDVVLNAQDRYDIGIYFATDGDQNNDGALTGSCSVSTLDYEQPAGVDLDGVNNPYPGTKKASGVQDTCGDINAAASPLQPLISITAKCVDDDGDGFLDLPNCVSWRQAGANDLCTSPNDTFPGAPSKCKCDIGFNVPVPVPADVSVAKTVKRAIEPDTAYGEITRISEPGEMVDYKVVFSVAGSAKAPNVTLNSLVDQEYGDITAVHGDIVSTTCSVPQEIPGTGGSYTCTYRVSVTGAAANPAPDKSMNLGGNVTASAVDLSGNVFAPQDPAYVEVDDVKPSIAVTKDARTTECLENALPCSVTFDVTVTNNSASTDPVTIHSLQDWPYGDITSAHGAITSTSCAATTITAGSTYSCAFTVSITGGNAGDEILDTVTASGTDDEGNDATASDSAMVTIMNVPSSITVQKSASTSSVKEPGESVTYTLTVTNDSTSDSFTLQTLTDDRFGDVTEVDGLISATDCAVGNVINPLASYTCAFTAFVGGDGGEVHTNVVEATGTDDDGWPTSNKDSETVNIANVEPAASLTKTAISALVTYQVSVTNDSEAEDLTLNSLMDDLLGDVTYVHGDIIATDCTAGRVLARSEVYTCTFTATVASSPHVNKVTAEVDDDEGDDDAVHPYDSAEVTFGK